MKLSRCFLECRENRPFFILLLIGYFVQKMTIPDVTLLTGNMSNSSFHAILDYCLAGSNVQFFSFLVEKSIDI